MDMYKPAMDNTRYLFRNPPLPSLLGPTAPCSAKAFVKNSYLGQLTNYPWEQSLLTLSQIYHFFIQVRELPTAERNEVMWLHCEIFLATCENHFLIVHKSPLLMCSRILFINPIPNPPNFCNLPSFLLWISGLLSGIFPRLPGYL